MTYPNFFIIGAPKCGTTALSEYLRGHRNILFSWPKEPHYFAEDFARYRQINNFAEYMALFRGKQEGHLAVGEASVWYLYSSVAVQKIHEYNGKAKIIVMLRNPADMLYSLHSEMFFTFFEDEPDFEKAWRLQPARQKGFNIPGHCTEPAFLQYENTARFGDQLERVFKIFDREQVKVILMEDMAASTRTVYQDVLAFLNIPDDGRTDFPRINLNKVHKRPWLGKFFYHPPYPLNVLEPKVRNFLSRLGMHEFRWWHRLADLSIKNESRPPLSKEFRNELQSVFRDDVHKLSALLDRDLSHWLEPTPEK